jgi:hypothetical protein
LDGGGTAMDAIDGGVAVFPQAAPTVANDNAIAKIVSKDCVYDARKIQTGIILNKLHKIIGLHAEARDMASTSNIYKTRKR